MTDRRTPGCERADALSASRRLSRRRHIVAAASITVGLFGLASSAVAADGDQAASGPMAAAEALLQRFFATSDSIHDYHVVMARQQRVHGDLQPVETLAIEHRRAPDCRYMRWIGNPHRGREMIYCKDRYDGKIEAHDSGFMSFLTVALDPNGSMATSNQLHRIYESGLFALTNFVRKDDDYLLGHPDLPPPQLSHRDVDGAPSTCVTLDQGADLFATYHLGRQELCIDDARALPTELSLWNDGGQLMEHYVYSQYQVNTGLTDSDFDVRNKKYGF
jgi:hypothetical protein